MIEASHIEAKPIPTSQAFAQGISLDEIENDSLDHPPYFDHGQMDAMYQRWLEILLTIPTPRLVSNVRTRWGILRVGGVPLPTTLNETDYENSYVCSPYNGCVLYPRSEVEKIGGFWIPTALRGLMTTMAPVLRAAHINRVVCINNWLLSTNLYPHWDISQLAPITQMLTTRYPQHAIAFRSLNETTNASLLQELRQQNYWLAPSRQVYFFDGRSGDYLRKANTRWDQKLLQSPPYRVVPQEELCEADVPRIESLYRWLYIDKYSEHNPQFTKELIEHCRRHRLLTMWGLKDETGRLDGIVGAFTRDGVMTVPLVGYDTSLPQGLGLYRRLMAIVLGEAARQRLLLNLSSGASEFKRLRGGTPCLEYTAVYAQHLPIIRRWVWSALVGMLQNIGAPLLRKYQL